MIYCITMITVFGSQVKVIKYSGLPLPFPPNESIVIFYNFTDLNYTQSAITNIIDNFDLEQEKQKLLTEQEINKNIDLSIFYSKEYFAVLQKREQ